MSGTETLITVVKKLAGLQTGGTSCCGGGATLTPPIESSDADATSASPSCGSGCCDATAADPDTTSSGGPQGPSPV